MKVNDPARAMLVDVGVWLALVSPELPQHLATSQWFSQINVAPAILCRLTQLSLLRLLTQNAVKGPHALTQREAWLTLDRLLNSGKVEWRMEPPAIDDAFRRLSDRDEISPKRWTDDYLLAFAEAANLTFVTFDRALAARAPTSILLTP